MAQKPHLNIVFIGHVDHGKSTTVGRLLLDTGYIRQEEIDKYRQEAEAKGKATFEFAEGPTKESWGWYATVRDPDGNELFLMPDL